MANPFLFLLSDDADAVVGRQRAAFGTFKQEGTAPDLIPFTPFNPSAPSQSQVQLIDVINDFAWTQTPAMGRHEVPFIRMSEYRVKFNSLVQNIKYQLQAFSETSQAIDDGLDVQQQKMGNIGTAATSLLEGAVKVTGAVTDLAKNITGTGMAPAAKSIPQYLRPYYGLYGAIPTGFEYYFPYFNASWKDVATTWGETAGGGLAAGMTQLFEKEGFASTMLDTALTDKNTLGAYIERPQMYKYGDSTPELTFQIILANTETEDEVIRNWHLAFMLAYQNLPNKTSKVFLEPPVLYEVEVPGTQYFPYAYISSVSIQNRGSNRVLTLPYYNITAYKEAASIPSEKDFFRDIQRWDAFSSDRAARNVLKTGLWHSIIKAEAIENDNLKQLRLVETVVPDAYEITIKVKSLLPESKNLLFHSALGSGTLGRGLYTATVNPEYDPATGATQIN